MNITVNNIVGELVAEDYRTASVFKANKIDFCCRGNRSIGEACEQNSIEPNKLIEQLTEVSSVGEASATNYESWPLDLLVDYIEKKHHRYVESKIPEIKAFLEKIKTVHGSRHPELIEIQELFAQSAGDLTAHMKKEEFILFPFIRKMEKAHQLNQRLIHPNFESVESPINMMKQEHDNEGVRFRKIRELTNDYSVPEDACTTYKVSFAMLEEFENDLHLHIHLENNILFPKAVKMESELEYA